MSIINAVNNSKPKPVAPVGPNTPGVGYKGSSMSQDQIRSIVDNFNKGTSQEQATTTSYKPNEIPKNTVNIKDKALDKWKELHTPENTIAQDSGYDLGGITKTITDSINDQIAQEIAAYNQQLATGQQANNLAVTQNTNYLNNQLEASGDQHTLDSSAANTLQNRRGGFYSGGLDYQLGSQDRAYATQEGNLRQDVQARNDDLYAKNALMATQAAENIKMLQSQAPGMIRQAIQDEIDRQRGINIQEAGITGRYNGAPTYNAQQDTITNNRNAANDMADYTGNYTSPQAIALEKEMANNSAAYEGASATDRDKLHARNLEIAKQLGMTYDPGSGTYAGGNTSVRTIAGQNADLNREQTMAVLTGYMSDGRGGYVPTNAKQQQDLTNAWNETEQLGKVTPALSQLTGIPVGTPTQTAKNQAIQNSISQQNANTSAANVNADNTRADNAVKSEADQKVYQSKVISGLSTFDDRAEAEAWLKVNAGDITNNLGAEGFAEMQKFVPQLFGEAPKPTDPAKDSSDLRERAVAAAQKDGRWLTASVADKASIIKEYESLFK